MPLNNNGPRTQRTCVLPEIDDFASLQVSGLPHIPLLDSGV